MTKKLECLLMVGLSARCNVTFSLIRLILELQRKLRVVNTIPHEVFTQTSYHHFLDGNSQNFLQTSSDLSKFIGPFFIKVIILF
jgi:hypothetical protein